MCALMTNYMYVVYYMHTLTVTKLDIFDVTLTPVSLFLNL